MASQIQTEGDVAALVGFLKSIGRPAQEIRGHLLACARLYERVGEKRAARLFWGAAQREQDAPGGAAQSAA